MLSSRQKWRHQSLVGIRRKDHDYLYSQVSSVNFFVHSQFNSNYQGIDDISRVIPKSASESSIGDTFFKATLGSKKHATTGSLVDSKHTMMTRTQVRFNPAIRVVLIPTVTEYRQLGLGEVMWWDDTHYKEFKLSAISELKLYMVHHPGLDSKAAIKHMYQPSERDNETPSPTKLDGSLPSSEKSLSARRNSGIITAEMLASNGLLIKSKAKSIKFEKSIFKPEAAPASAPAAPGKDPALASGPLGPMGLIMG